MAQRLMIYDTTTLKDDTVDLQQGGLTFSWFAGGRLYRWVRWLDKCKGVESWDEALDWLIEQGKKEPISMIQYWGHGYWGRAYIGNKSMKRLNTLEGDPWRLKLEELSGLMTDDAVWWWRTCQTYGSEYGHRFAKHFTNILNCKTVGHTHIIGFRQSGGQVLMPGEEPKWSVDEGIKERPPGRWPVAKRSSLRAPNTILCLQGFVPDNW